jgi:hypothetical protein
MTEISERFVVSQPRSPSGSTRCRPTDGTTRRPATNGWRDVVRHLVGNAERFLGFVDRLPPGPSVDDDPAGAWASADGPGRARRSGDRRSEFDGRWKQTFEQAMDRFGPDVVIHQWDLARATGLDEHLDPDDVHAIFEAMEPMDEMMRANGSSVRRSRPSAPTSRPACSRSGAPCSPDADRAG